MWNLLEYVMNFHGRKRWYAGMSNRQPYPSDVFDEEGVFMAPYLTLVRPDAPQHTHKPVRRLQWAALGRATGSPWCYVLNDLPPREAVYQQTRRWLWAGSSRRRCIPVRPLLRLASVHEPDPRAGAILDSRTLRSTPESGWRAGYDGPSARRAPRATRRWTPSNTCSPCMLPRRTCRTGWGWSSTRRPSVGSCCCRAGGYTL